jgi:hypothetical protein
MIKKPQAVQSKKDYIEVPTKPIVVAFSGRRGSGKSEACKILCEELGFYDLKFAAPLKNMLRALYTTCGVDSDTIERKIEGDLKERPCEWLSGRTPRHAMQTLGTEWREMLSTELWSDMFFSTAMSGTYGDRITCSDYRFMHEAVVLEKLGAIKCRIFRPTADAADDEAAAHVSEQLADTLPHDFTITNDGTLEDFREKVRHQIASKL